MASSMKSAKMSTNSEITISDLKKLMVEALENAWWISELSAMADEVRDRTVVVGINDQMHPISDSVIWDVFSEIDVVEDVRYMPVASGFLFRLRFSYKHSADLTRHYYNGCKLHQGCCDLKIWRVDDVISWHAQRVADLKATYGIVDTPLMTTKGDNQEVMLDSACIVNQVNEPPQTGNNYDQIVAKKHLDLVAHQVFDEMPILMDSGTELGDAFPKDFKVLLDDTLDQEAPPTTSDEEKDGSNSKVFEVCKAETELCDELELANVHVRALCFDPGGRALKLVDNSLNLEDGTEEGNDRRHCCHKELNDMRCLFGASYFDRTTQEHVVCDASKVNFQPKKLMLETFSVGSDMQLMVVHFLFELLVKTSYGKVEDITKHELDDDVQLLVFDPGGNGLDLALSTLDVGVLKYHDANVFVFDPGGKLSMLLVLEPIACLEKIGSSILNFGILDDNPKGVIMRRSTLIEDNISAQVWDSYTGIILASIKPLGLLIYVSNDSEMHVLKSSAVIDHDEELGRLTWASYNQNYLAATPGKCMAIFLALKVKLLLISQHVLELDSRKLNASSQDKLAGATFMVIKLEEVEKLVVTGKQFIKPYVSIDMYNPLSQVQVEITHERAVGVDIDNYYTRSEALRYISGKELPRSPSMESYSSELTAFDSAKMLGTWPSSLRPHLTDKAETVSSVIQQVYCSCPLGALAACRFFGLVEKSTIRFVFDPGGQCLKLADNARSCSIASSRVLADHMTLIIEDNDLLGAEY